MFTINVLCFILLVISLSRIAFSIPVPDESSDELLCTSTITDTSPAPDRLTTELQNFPKCETVDQWAECEAFLEEYLNEDSKEYEQLMVLKNFSRKLGSHSSSLPTVATFLGYTHLIQVLLRNGVPVNKKYTLLEETVLHVAAKCGYADLVTWVLTEGADTEVKDWEDNTPLHAAVNHFESTTVKLLLDAGADVNAANEFGETPLFQAIKYIQFGRVLHIEFECGVFKNVNAKEIIEILLEHGADPDIPEKKGRTPLHLSAIRDYLDIVKLLIDGGANINATDDDNQTPLHKAVDWNNVSVVEYLVTKGCDKTITDIHNKTALDIAKERRLTVIVDLLSRES